MMIRSRPSASTLAMVLEAVPVDDVRVASQVQARVPYGATQTIRQALNILAAGGLVGRVKRPYRGQPAWHYWRE